MTTGGSSLGRRLLIGASAVIVVALVVTGVAMSFALYRFIRGQVDGRLDGQLTAVADALRAGPDGRLTLERVVDGPPFDRPLSGWYWEVFADGPALRSRSLDRLDIAVGAVVADHPPPPPPDEVPPPPPESRPRTADGTGPRAEALRVRLREVTAAGRVVTIVAAAPRKALFGPLREAMVPVAVTLALLGMLLVGGGVLQVWLGLRPLRLLRADLADVRDGRAERIAGPQPAEIAALVADLNTLLDQHAANLERARRNVANLAHGLKTPLATLGVVIDEPGADARDRLKPLVAAMDRMIRHHLARARAAALDGPVRSRTTLAPRIADHQLAFARLYADKRLAFTIDAAADVVVACEPQDLDEILGNLIDNACKWARGRVGVRAEARQGRVAIAIEDDGPGLPDGEAAEALRPGRRMDEHEPGYGFGLPIARELAELYGGGIALVVAPLGGLGVVVDLPRAV